MNRRHRMKVLWGTLAFLLLAVVAFNVALCPLSDADVGAQRTTAPEAGLPMDAGGGSATHREWDWEWHWDTDPTMLGRPTYLR
jgi:hypothetical protein